MSNPPIVKRGNHKYVQIHVLVTVKQYHKMKKHDEDSGNGLSGVVREALHRYFASAAAMRRWVRNNARRRKVRVR